VVTIYLLADVGSIGGGWLPLWLINRGHTVNFARKMSFWFWRPVVVPVCMASVVTTTCRRCS